MNLPPMRATILLAAVVASAICRPLYGEGQAPYLRTASAATDPGVLSRTVTVEVEGVRLGEVLATISRQADFGLIYGNRVVPVEQRITVRLDQATVAEALRTVLRDTDVEFALAPAGQVVLARREAPRAAEARVATITGRVTDARSAQPIAGATVLVVGTSRASQSDPTGRYTITGVAAGALTLRASRVGGQDGQCVDGLHRAAALDLRLLGRARPVFSNAKSCAIA